MRLLIVTQVVDTQNPVLGFFHGWIAALAARVEQVEVICLYKGVYELPDNVRVHSLGKEALQHATKGRGVGRRVLLPFTYAWRFLKLAWRLRTGYDTVFVHMNEEYPLIAGWLWKLLNMRVFMWRNHYAGSWRTRIAACFCTKVFCTSKHSFTARFKKTELMPVGVDIEKFMRDAAQPPAPRSILFLARIAPSKRPDLLIEALGLLIARGVSFTASIVGSPPVEHQRYYANVQARAEALGLHDRVRFHAGVPHDRAPLMFSSHEYFVNASPSGMLDKTIFEAAAAGAIVLASSDDFRDAAGDDYYFADATQLAEKLSYFLNEDSDTHMRRRIALQALAREESLGTLADRLAKHMQY